jgi:ABC-2 type transport system permease protein
MTAFRLELRRNRSLTAWLSVMLAGYGAVIAAMYPIMVDNAQAFEDYMAIFPEEFLAAFGMTGSLADPGVFFATYIGSMLWPIVAAIAAIILATRPVAADVERGWSEVVLGTRLTRTAGLLAAITAQMIVLAVLAVATVGGILGVGALVGAGFDPAPFLAASAIMWLFGCAVAGVTSLLGAVTLSRAVAGGIAAGVLLMMYLVNVVAQVQPELAWLADFGAFKYLAVTRTVDLRIVPRPSIIVFGVVAVGAWVASIVVFRRRDLLA